MPDDEKKELRAQRHDFIKEYYKMAVADLDRHLKAGWQTIAVLAGVGALLVAGHEGKIGLPIAIDIAVGIACWGALIVIDSNYWSVRAIAFLANVEALYFSVEDRKYFNPYAGLHPGYKLLDSLRYHLWIFIFFGCACVLDFTWEIWRAYPSSSAFASRLVHLNWLQVILWASPLAVLLWVIYVLIAVYRKRLDDYLSFSESSPGPPMRLNTRDFRHVDLSPKTDSADPPVEVDGHRTGLEQLRNQRAEMRRWPRSKLPYLAAVAATIAILAFAAVQAFRVHL